MILGKRIKERMKALDMSQAELARRIGIKQPSVYALIHTNKRGSAHLHKIARELETTPEYLTGETDNPESELPGTGVLILDSETREILQLLDRMSPGDKRALVQVARSMAKVPAESGAMHEPKRLEYKQGK